MAGCRNLADQLTSHGNVDWPGLELTNELSPRSIQYNAVPVELDQDRRYKTPVKTAAVHIPSLALFAIRRSSRSVSSGSSSDWREF
ncbi:hypothetical protein ElyMa_007025800 [Elysia marginata]|uniref:Uncharacterized protein n=1 Tax=Elysia marginata TaxID=1093978 RepID=A0AAV4JTS9_9GAST|nr:hypothetical protein ElyMa_007025800 [Elysia marginata]